MMRFLLSKTNSLDEKYDFITLTLAKTLTVLDFAIKARNYLLEIELLSYLKSILKTLPDMEKNHDKK